jgi:hypothetical protein
MNIPLGRLYHYINNAAEEMYGDRVIIYHFYPHGSKNIKNLINLEPFQTEWLEKITSPIVWCNDQEPLDYEFYYRNRRVPSPTEFTDVLKDIGKLYVSKNLNYVKNMFSKNILLHSEQRSDQLKLYQYDNELIPVYYWSHALISRDWFRYAEHTRQRKKVKKTFLIYNRAWSGTREYRLRFAELIINQKLTDKCKMRINPIEPELNIHYDLHEFSNDVWRPQVVLEDYFDVSSAKSSYSADFDIKDYESTEIEVVLETLFDDFRLHLTEKSLRPIACGQPFILAATYGSLEYLRGYGFKTFGHIWDETYDTIKDPYQRLNAVADLMKEIDSWEPWIHKEKLAQAQVIADYNRQRFFSQDFFNLITDELKINLQTGFKQQLEENNIQVWIDRWTNSLTYPRMLEFLENNKDPAFPTSKTLELALTKAKKLKQ